MSKKSKILSLCIALSAIFGGINQANADIVYTPISSSVSTVKSPYLYISLNDMGTLGNGNTSPGILHDPTGSGNFSDTSKDYLTPGAPFEGFFVNATNATAPYTSIGNYNGGSANFTASGALTNNSTIHNADISWTGSNSSIGMTVTNQYTFSDTSQYIKIRTTLTATQNLTGVQFLRSLDPDQDAPLGSYQTNNTLGLTTSSGKVIPASDAAVASGPVRPDLKIILYSNSTIPHAAGISAPWTHNPANYLGSTPLNDGSYGDYAIGMGFNVGTLNSGSSTELVYYYLFSDSASVLDSLITEIISGGIVWKDYITQHGGNVNAQSAGGVLDTLTAMDGLGHTSATQKYLIDNFAASDPTKYVTLATALSGEIHAAMAAEMPLSSIWLQNTVSDVLFKSSTKAGCSPTGNGGWVAAGRNWDRWYNDSNASGIMATRDQFAFGYDLMAAKKLRLGAGYSYSSIDVKTANDSKGTANKQLFFLYGQYDAGKVLFESILGGGPARWATTRLVSLGGSTDRLDTSDTGVSGLAGLSVRMPLVYKNISIQPYASALWLHEERSAINEGTASAAALSLPGYVTNGNRMSVGLSISSVCRNPVLSPTTFKLDFEGGLDSPEIANPQIASELAGIPYKIVSPSVSRTYGQARAEATVRVAKAGYCYADYIGMVRSGGNSQGVELGFKYTF